MCRQRRSISLSLSHVFAIGICCAFGNARGAPFDEPHLGGIGFPGPTTGDLAAVYWNPAAIGLIEGNRLQLGNNLAMTRTTVARAAIDPATGAPGTGMEFPSARGTGTTQPWRWPPGPGSFAGLAVDLAGSFNLAVVLYSPFHQHIRYARDDGPPTTRYHAIEARIEHLALTPVLAFRLGRSLRIGVGPGFLFSNAHLTFDEDTALVQGTAGLTSDCGGVPCGVEHPNAAARYALRGSGIFGDAPALLLSGGIHYGWDEFSIGAAYGSRPIGNQNEGVEIDLSRTRLTLPPRDDVSPALCPTGSTRACIDGMLGYQLPDVYILGGAWHPKKSRFAATATARYQRFSRHEALTIRIVGPAAGTLGQGGLEDRFLVYRGWQDRLDLRGFVSYTPLSDVTVGVGLRFATPAVPREAVNPAAVDGPTFEPQLGASARWRWLTITAGYALAITPTVNVTNSAFRPEAATACADANNDIARAECSIVSSGAGRPTAVGRYSQVRHALTLSATTHF